MVSWPGSMISLSGMIRVEANSYYKRFRSFVVKAKLFYFTVLVTMDLLNKRRIRSAFRLHHLNTNQQEAKQIKNSNDMKNRVATGRYPGHIGVLTSISANAFRMPCL